MFNHNYLLSILMQSSYFESKDLKQTRYSQTKELYSSGRLSSFPSGYKGYSYEERPMNYRNTLETLYFHAIALQKKNFFFNVERILQNRGNIFLALIKSEPSFGSLNPELIHP